MRAWSLTCCRCPPRPAIHFGKAISAPVHLHQFSQSLSLNTSLGYFSCRLGRAKRLTMEYGWICEVTSPSRPRRRPQSELSAAYYARRLSLAQDCRGLSLPIIIHQPILSIISLCIVSSTLQSWIALAPRRSIGLLQKRPWQTANIRNHTRKQSREYRGFCPDGPYNTAGLTYCGTCGSSNTLDLVLRQGSNLHSCMGFLGPGPWHPCFCIADASR